MQFGKPLNYTPLKMKKSCRNMLGAGTMLFNKLVVFDGLSVLTCEGEMEQ